MKTKGIIVTVLLLASVTCQGQKSAKKPRYRYRENGVLVELAGTAVIGVGLSYERYFNIGLPVKYLVRAGLNLIDYYSTLSPHVGGSVLVGGNHNLELGYNMIFGPDLSKLDSDPRIVDVASQLLIGYRVQPPIGRFLMRAYVVPPVLDFDLPTFFFFTYGGITFGYTF
ncbi:MAG: hypothetical protein AAGA66_11570 [Bacteroidota bacterium]